MACCLTCGSCVNVCLSAVMTNATSAMPAPIFSIVFNGPSCMSWSKLRNCFVLCSDAASEWKDLMSGRSFDGSFNSTDGRRDEADAVDEGADAGEPEEEGGSEVEPDGGGNAKSDAAAVSASFEAFTAISRPASRDAISVQSAHVAVR